MQFYEEFQNRLKLAAKQMFGTQKAMAKATGINEKQISNYISGINLPGKQILDKFQAAGISAEWLMTGKGNMSVHDDSAQEDDLLNNVLDVQRELTEKIDLFLKTKYGGKVAAGRLPKDTEGD